MSVVLSAKVDLYQTKLIEPHRPPSRGANTRAWHVHVLTIDGERYSFRALGARRWVLAKDAISFEWKWDETKRYRNIDVASIRTVDQFGGPVVHGLRGGKPWRTAPSRMPASRREQRD